MEEQAAAVVLLSGGLDSTTVLAIAQSEGYRCWALTFRYGQRHQQEVTAAGRIAQAMRVFDHRILDIDLRQFGGSALTADLDVPKPKRIEDIGGSIPLTYVPARNTIFLAYALALCEVIPARDIFIGVNALDYSGYPDCRPEYIAAFQQLANLATRTGLEGSTIRIHAPLLNANKAEIIARGLALGVDYSLTTSCYDPRPDGAACGRCDACLLRRRGFSELGLMDPIVYHVLDS